MNYPKVSICIPTYNQTYYLVKLLDSILIQTFTDFEVIISDDSNTENVKLLIDTYSKKINFKYFKNYPAFGTPLNWNKSIELATGEFIKIMHHDDWFTDLNSLQKFVKYAQICEYSFVFSGAISINEKENTEQLHLPNSDFLNEIKQNPNHLFFGNLIGPPSSVIFKKSDVIYFDVNLKWVVDVDFYIRMLKNSKSYCFIKEPLICSVNNAKHSVTNDCINKEVEIYEYIYLYKKLNNANTFGIKYIKFFKNLFKKYNVDKKELLVLTKDLTHDLNIRLAMLFKNFGF